MRKTGKGTPPPAGPVAPPPPQTSTTTAAKATTNGKPNPPPQDSEPGRPLDKTVRSAEVDLNFKVPAEVKREFDIFAAERGMKKKKLLLAMWEFYKKNAA